MSQVNRALRLLSACNHALVRAEDESALIQQICDIAVDYGGYLMAWVGEADHGVEKRVLPLASAGIEEGYLDSIRITWDDSELGQGPTGIAIRSRQPAINQNIWNNPKMRPWRDDAIRRGFQSSISLPLIVDHAVFGTLTMYAVEPNAFQSQEVELLEEMAGDLAFGIATLRARQEQARTQKALKESEFLFRSQFDLGNIGIAITSPAKGWLRVNRKLCEILGYTEEELRQKTWDEITHPDDLARNLAVFHKMRTGEIDNYEMDKRFIHKDGRAVYVHLTTACLREAGELSMVIASVLDITESHEHLQKLALMAGVFENTLEGVIITDAQGQIITVNEAFTDITGFTQAEALGKTPRILRSDFHDAAFFKEMWSTLETRGRWRGEIWNRRKDGSTYPQWLTISDVRDTDGAVSHYVSVFSDITELKRSEEQLEYLAYHDQLTGLPNRVLFQERLSQAVESARVNHVRLALLHLDIDRFKTINDSFGHAFGDEILRQVAKRLAEAAGKQQFVARLGGDEFVVLEEQLSSNESLDQLASGMLKLIAKPFLVMGREVFVTGSVGITIFPDEGEDALSLLKQSDMAMYEAKAKGRNTLYFYESGMGTTAMQRMLLENALRGALKRNEFLLHYQPQIDVETGRLDGVESLLRWQHPELGMVSPGQFIPLAEEMGIICQIGRWALSEACRQFAEWRTAGLHLPYLAVNLSVQQLTRDDLVGHVSELLEKWSIDPARLELEVTESMLMEPGGRAVEVLEGLRNLGVFLAVDDFGTGYSSLGYLKRLPIHRLKIDQSFVRDIGSDVNDEAIVKAIIAMAKSLGLGLIAEGVETPVQADFLRDAGCPIQQGYLYSRPVPGDEITANWLG